MRVTLATLLDRLGELTKADLKQLASRQGLSTKGTRDELIHRLVTVPKQSTPDPNDLTYQQPPQ